MCLGVCSLWGLKHPGNKGSTRDLTVKSDNWLLPLRFDFSVYFQVPLCMHVSCVCECGGGEADCGWWWWSPGVGAEGATLTSRWGNWGCADCECELGSGDLFCVGGRLRGVLSSPWGDLGTYRQTAGKTIGWCNKDPLNNFCWFSLKKPKAEGQIDSDQCI